MADLKSGLPAKRPTSFISSNRTPLPIITEELDMDIDDIEEVLEEGKLTVGHKNAGLVIDIYNVRKFSLSCKKVYENFQSENEITIQIKDTPLLGMPSP
jgi:hypothetical protein